MHWNRNCYINCGASSLATAGLFCFNPDDSVQNVFFAVGADLSVCEAWTRGSRSRSRSSSTSVSCCTRQMEARLTTHARHELSQLITGKLSDVRHDFSSANQRFESTPSLYTIWSIPVRNSNFTLTLTSV